MGEINVVISGCSEEVRHELYQIITRAIMADSPAVGGITIYTVENLEHKLDDRVMITDFTVAQRLRNRGWEVL